MAQKKKKTAASRRKGGITWQQKQKRSGKTIALLIGIGVLVGIGAYLLQYRGSETLNLNETRTAENTVRLNEVVAKNLSSVVTESGDTPDWVEITNTGSESVNLARYSLVLESSINDMFIFPDYTLESGECLLIYCEGSDAAGSDYAFSAPFKIGASGDDTLTLLDAGGQAVDSVELPELKAGEAYARMDGDSWSVQTPTPAASNDSVQSAEAATVSVVADVLEISEVCSSNTFFFADENGEKHDYVEIHNTGSEDVNLEGWYLSDSSDKLKKWAFPDVTLPAGGYLAVHCSGYDRTTSSRHLHTSFKLSSKGETVYLTRPDGRTVSTVELPAMETNQAYSLSDGAWTLDLAATPNAANTSANAAQTYENLFGTQSGALRINEILTSTSGSGYDWVEIYNASGETVDLSGYGLSDDASKPRKWQFPQGTQIQSGEYIGVLCSGREEETLEGYINADFALSASGGYNVTLSDSTGKVMDAVYLPRQYSDISYGRVEGLSGYYYFETTTPGKENSGAYYVERAAEAQASVEGGVFNTGDSFTVALSAPAGSRIYYTLDCTDPDENSTLYTGPITVSSTTILRSRVYRDGCMPSLSDTQSYLFDVGQYYDMGTTYIVSLVSDPDNLYSDEKGIMVKGPNATDTYPYGSMNSGANFWMDWEREAHVELFKEDEGAVISQGCGLKLHGQYSRALEKKAFKVIARSEYGSNRFEYPIFSNRDYEEYQSFILRASGQDYNKVFMRDSVFQQLAKDTSVMYQEAEVGVCFLNGEYYSLYYLRERINTHSICQFEGWEGMEDDLDLIKANSREMQGSNETFQAILDWIAANDVTGQTFVDYLDERIDIQNYFEYMAIQIFIGNGDTLNVKRYRNANTDGKWRWVLFDLDWAFVTDTNSIRRWLDPEGMGTGKRTSTKLFVACMSNPTLRDRFLTYMGERMATAFTTENILSMFTERYDQIEELVLDYRQRMAFTKDISSHLKDLKNYAEQRPTKLLGYFKEAFNFTDAEMEHYFGAAMDEIEKYENKEGGA